MGMAVGFFWEPTAVAYGFEFWEFWWFLEMWGIGVIFAFD